MRRSIDRDALERDVIAAHTLYIASLTRLERVGHDLRRGVPGVTALERQVADSEHHRRFVALRDRLDALGFVPRGLTARLPPGPGADA